MLLALFAAGLAVAQPIIDYRFDEGGNVALNSGTFGASGNGTLDNVLRSPDHQPFQTGSSVYLNGSNSFIRVQDNFSYGNQVTVEAWIKPALTNSQRVIWDDYGNPGVLLTVLNGAVQFAVSTLAHPGPGAELVDGVTATNIWQHVAGTYDGQNLRVFVNGRTTGRTTATSGIVTENSFNPAIGSDNLTTTALNFAGWLDDFRIHTRALSADELAGGAFARLNITNTLDDAVIWWRTNEIGFRLEWTPNLTTPWQAPAEAPSQSGPFLYITNKISAGQKFYRLTSP